MFNWKDFEGTKKILSHVGGHRYKDEWGQHHLFVRPNEFLDWMEFLKGDQGFFTISEMVAEESLAARDSDYELVYSLLNMETHQRVNLHLNVNRGELIPSVAKHFPHAAWMEREQAEMVNLSFVEKMDPLFLPAGQKSFPLSKNPVFTSWPEEPTPEIPALKYNPNKSEPPYPEESYLWKMFDLKSPNTQGHFEWLVCFDPTRVVDSKLRVGFHHQGLELLLQNKDIFQIVQLVDKVNLSAAPNMAIAWTKTIEEQFRIKIPERAQAIRIVMLELARIGDHLSVLASLCRQSKVEEYTLFLNARERIYELFEKYSGHRHGLGVSRIGGVKEDLPPGWIVEYQSVAEVLNKNLRVIHQSLLGQTQFRSLLDGEPVNAQSVLQCGVSGPAMRAAGLNFDLRKSQPFYFYQDIDFDIPVGIHGTSFDRYLIRYEEIFQSLRIITQVIDNLPLGEIISTTFDKNYLELHELFSSLEKPTQWHYSSVEAPSGEAGFFVRFAGDLKPARIKLKTPGFSLAQALPIFTLGLREEQLPITLLSLGLSRWEMDR
jgi:NADH-quinone oxidoreductase subunit C/D